MNLPAPLPTRTRLAVEVSHYVLSALCLLPFLIPLHTMPIGSFYSEWTALLLGLLGFPVLLVAPQPRLPKIALLPLAFAALILVQRCLYRPVYPEPAMIAILYLLWVCFVMQIAATVVSLKGLEATVQRLASWLLGGSLLNAFAVFAFAITPLDRYILFHPNPPGNIFIAQANHLAHYLWLGIASALYLFHKQRLRGWQLAACASLLVCASALTTSRASLSYAVWLVALVALCRLPRLYRPVLAIALAYLLLLVGLPYLGLGGDNALTRLVGDLHGSRVHGASIRLQLIKSGWNIFLEHPLLGAGLGAFPAESFNQVGLLTDRAGTAEHAHQVFVNLLAELGIAAPFLLAVPLFWWGQQLWQRRTDAPTFWIAALSGIGFLHAQVEYPLWYAFFLGPFAVALALVNTGSLELRTPRFLWLPILCAGLAVLTSVYCDYLKLEKWSYADATRPPETRIPADYYQPLIEASKGSLLRPWMETRIAMQMPPSGERLADKLVLCKNSLGFVPVSPTAFTCALLYSLDGRKAEAKALWQRSEVVFTDEAAALYSRLILPQAPAEIRAQYAEIVGKEPKAAP